MIHLQIGLTRGAKPLITALIPKDQRLKWIFSWKTLMNLAPQRGLVRWIYARGSVSACEDLRTWLYKIIHFLHAMLKKMVL
jgi:hypothetical protein